MVLDTSAVLAVFFREPGADRLEGTMLGARSLSLSAASLVEAGMVAQGRLGDDGEEELDLLLLRLNVEIVPVTEAHAGIARSAFRRFGKGRHPAALDFGDCFSHALARAVAEPLLFVGDDFSRTDVAAAAY
jgi:ribonuclease VapC